MISLGSIYIKNESAAIHSKDKIISLCGDIGCRNIQATRVATSVSEVFFSHYSCIGKGVELDISLKKNSDCFSLLLCFKVSLERPKISFLNALYDEVEVIEKDGEKCINTSLIIGDIAEFPSEDLIDKIRIDLNKLSKDELMEELKKTTIKAESASKAKSDFLATMSHEIRTPMNAIIGLSDLCLQTEMSDKQRDYISKVNSSGKALLGIINDILDFSKVEAGKMTLENTDLNLQSLLDQVITVTRFKAEEKGIDLKYDIKPSVPIALIGDSLRLSQVLINLTNNAVKFTDEGHVHIIVNLLEMQENDTCKLHFSIKDSGIGINEEQIRRLFKSFSQADSSTTRKYGGTGLGLAISKKIVELMNGEIWVESEVGVGSTFQFTIDLDLNSKTMKEDKSNNVITNDLSSIEGAKVLLVEDNNINQQVAMEFLNKIHLLVEVANNGKEAIEMLDSSCYDCVLMDLQMPVMDGLTATEIIRKDPKYKNLPIIALTANAMESDSKNIIRVGMNDHVSKPIETQKLYDALLKWIPARAKTSKSTLYSTVDKTEYDGDKSILEIEDIDTVKGIRNVGGNKALYLDLLRKFVKDHGDDIGLIQNYFEQGDFLEAQRMVHTIKGVVATLGAGSLVEHSANLEKAFQKKDLETIPSFLRDFKFSFSPFIAILRSELLDNKQDNSLKLKSTGNGLSLDSLKPEFEELFTLLHDLDPESENKAINLITLLRDQELNNKILNKFAKEIENFEFDEARETLEIIFTQVKKFSVDKNAHSSSNLI